MFFHQNFVRKVNFSSLEIQKKIRTRLQGELTSYQLRPDAYILNSKSGVNSATDHCVDQEREVEGADDKRSTRRSHGVQDTVVQDEGRVEAKASPSDDRSNTATTRSEDRSPPQPPPPSRSKQDSEKIESIRKKAYAALDRLDPPINKISTRDSPGEQTFLISSAFVSVKNAVSGLVEGGDLDAGRQLWG